MILVTAADHTHGRSLMQMLASARSHEPKLPVIVYDLGLSPEQAAQARALGGILRSFDFDRYPDFFDVRTNAGEYAWKPTIVAEVGRASPGLVLWMDAGNVLTRRLYYIRAQLLIGGFYSPRSAGTVEKWTHPGMLDYLGADGLDLSRPNFNGACVGFNTRRPRARRLLEEWARLAAIRACIAPEGSDRTNHRQDQALLTVLAYKQGFKPKPRRSFRFHQDIKEVPDAALRAEAP